MVNDSRSRKWQITINNPCDKGFSHNSIKDILTTFKSLLYWCMCDEIGTTFHTHVFIALGGAVRFSTLQNKFDGAHFEMAYGTCQQNRDYICKSGKWEKDRKKETNLTDTFEEFGVLPVERQGQRNDIIDLYDMIKSGCSNYEILETNATYMLNLDKVERTRQIIRDDKYCKVFRHLEVTYIFGNAGSGKTRSVMDQYGYENVYRVTDYDHPFDSYNGQDVIVFEEFRSSIKISDMLNYLDGYPLELPCRYANKVACFTKCYIITNIPLEHQYESVQQDYNESWLAFLRRIHFVHEYGVFGLVVYKSISDYMLRFESPEQLDMSLVKVGDINV
ncbi:MAG: replication protein [Clostridia bacterium]